MTDADGNVGEAIVRGFMNGTDVQGTEEGGNVSNGTQVRFADEVMEREGVQFARYRKRPVVIEAARIADSFEVDTLEGTHHGSPGDWLIRGIAGELYPCKPDIFERTYDQEVGLTIAEEAQRPFDMTFHNGDREIGKFCLDPETDKLCFEGDLAESGELFIEHVLGQFREMYEKHQGDAS